MSKSVLHQMLEDIELPYVVKRTVKDRYEDLGKWLNRDDSTIAKYRPYVFPQGSFLLQTAIRPISSEGVYDLDIGCKFMKDLSADNIDQKTLKLKLGEELEKYRIARRIKAELEEKKRCWRLEYQDKISFHIDVVPCIPATVFDGSMYGSYYENTYQEGDLLISEESMKSWEGLSVLITDNESPHYERVSDNWKRSNPEGFGKWFSARVALVFFKEVQLAAERNANIADLPITWNQEKEVLRHVIKLLKRHRDVMFEKNSDFAPISIIISKLAADAYKGESDLASAITNIIEGMLVVLKDVTIRIANPTEPAENYADKWAGRKDYRTNFETWLIQAKSDFSRLIASDVSADTAEDILCNRFCLTYKDEYKKLFQDKPTCKETYPEPFNILSAKNKPWRNEG